MVSHISSDLELQCHVGSAEQTSVQIAANVGKPPHTLHSFPPAALPSGCSCAPRRVVGGGCFDGASVAPA